MSLASADGLVLGVEDGDAGDRAEGLLVRDQHVLGHAVEQGRREERAGVEVRAVQALAADEQLRRRWRPRP